MKRKSNLEHLEVPANYEIRQANADDLESVVTLLRPYMEKRLLLNRSSQDVAGLLATGYVAVFEPESDEAKVIGFSAVEIYSKKLSEIQCLAVDGEHRRHGLGRILVQRCVDLAKQRGVMEVMAISSSEKFLRDLGFDYSLPDQKRALFYQLRERD